MRACGLLAIVAALFHGAEARAGSYTFTTIDAPGASDTYLYGMNDVGQIVGFASGANPTAFVWRNGVFSPVPGNAYGINNSGQIVGVFGQQGYLYSDGVLTFIPGVTSARGINDAGDIVGNVGFPSKGYLYSNGTLTYLNVTGFDQTSAADINNSGQIVGTYENFSDLYFNSYVYKDGLFTPLDPPGAVVLGNYWFTEAMSINEAGMMAGFMRDESGPHAFVYVNGTFTFVDFPGASDTLLYGINNAGQLVGDYTVPGGGSHGFLATPIPESAPEPATALLVSLSALLMLTKRASDLPGGSVRSIQSGPQRALTALIRPWKKL